MNFLQTKCFSCASKNHISIDCPLIHYVPDYVKVVKKYMIDPGQKSRSNFKRTRNTKFNSLNSLALVKQTSQNIKELFSEFSFDEIYEDEYTVEIEEVNSNSNFEPKQIQVNEETPIKIEKSASQKFGQYFLKEKSIEKIPRGFNEFDNQLESSVIIEKIGLENFSSAWDSHQIIDIPENENENDEISKEKPLPVIEEKKLAFTNTDVKKPEANNFRLRSKISVDNYLEIPSRAMQKSFSSDHSSASNLNPNENPKSCLKTRLSIPKNDFRISEVKSAGLISKHSFNSKGNSNSGISARIPVRAQDARRNSITTGLNNNLTKNLPIINKMSSKDFENGEQNDNNNDQNTDLTDIFIKEFEKGTNFKNFYPDSNLKTVLLENRRKSKKMKSPGLKMGKNARSPVCLNKKMKTIVKINKIVPEALEIDKTSPLRKETILSRKNSSSRRYSNIFVKRSETKFSEKKVKMSFYDIVNEVLHNQELRKKLALMRKKSLNRKKTNT